MFQHLFSPLTVRGLRLENRVIMAAVATKLGTESGAVSEANVEFYRRRAVGNVGLIVIENTCVDWPVGKAGVSPLRLDHDKYITGINRIAQAVHPYGTKMATQLQHTGAQTNLLNTDGLQPVAPSAIPLYGVAPRVLNRDDIAELVAKFGDSARRTQQAGFDCVEIHGAHGYIFSQFISPILNKRTDSYGGSLENRMRFSLEVVQAVRAKVGPHLPIVFRYSASDRVAGGLSLDESKDYARALVDAGVDILSVSSGISLSRHWIFPPMGLPRGCNVELARAIKSCVGVPVAVAGRINDPATAERILEEGAADLVAIGRPLLADPDWVKKAREGKQAEIRPCISCNNGCIGRTHRHWAIGCDVNPTAGDEIHDRPSTPAATPKRIYVAGGGPAGMQAAAAAARRGHRVTLFETAPALGGKLLLAAVPSFKTEIRNLVEYLIRQTEEARVEVRLGRSLDLETITRELPDMLIVATGSTPVTLDATPGGPAVLTAEDVLRRRDPLKGSVIVAGGGEIGCETALHIAETWGCPVSVVEAEKDVLGEAETANRMWLNERLGQAGVKLVTRTAVHRVTAQGLLATGQDGPLTLAADTVVVALGSQPDNRLAELAAPLVAEVVTIGDALEPRRIWHAIHEGWFTGEKLA